MQKLERKKWMSISINLTGTIRYAKIQQFIDHTLSIFVKYETKLQYHYNRWTSRTEMAAWKSKPANFERNIYI